MHLQQVFHEVISGKCYIMQLDATHVQKEIYSIWNIVFSQDIILDDSGRIWLHLQQVEDEIVSGKCYIVQLDPTHAKK